MYNLKLVNLLIKYELHITVYIFLTIKYSHTHQSFQRTNCWIKIKIYSQIAYAISKAMDRNNVTNDFVRRTKCYISYLIYTICICLRSSSFLIVSLNPRRLPGSLSTNCNCRVGIAKMEMIRIFIWTYSFRWISKTG